jgi:hypothetical protein
MHHMRFKRMLPSYVPTAGSLAVSLPFISVCRPDDGQLSVCAAVLVAWFALNGDFIFHLKDVSPSFFNSRRKGLCATDATVLMQCLCLWETPSGEPHRMQFTRVTSQNRHCSVDCLPNVDRRLGR